MARSLDRPNEAGAPGDLGALRRVANRLRAALTTRDPALAYQVSRGLVAVALAAAALIVLGVTKWLGAVVVVVASIAVLLDASLRIWWGRTGGVLLLHFIDVVVIGLALILSDLPALLAIGPYGYLLTGAVLLLSRRLSLLVAAWAGIWVVAILVFGEPVGAANLDQGIVWTATAVGLIVYLAATMYLTSVAAEGMRERGYLSESLRNSRARLHAIVENSSVVAFALDTRGRMTYTEGDGLRALGAARAGSSGEFIYDLLPEATDLHLAIQEALTGAQAIGRDIRIGAAAFHVRLTPELDASGTVTGLIGIATNETERVLASDALRRKVEMEQLISRLSTHLIGLPPDEIEDGVALALEAVAEFVGADRAVVALSTDEGGLARAQAYEVPGIDPVPPQYQRHTPDDLPWLYSRLTSGRMLAFSTLDAIPREAWRLAEVWRSIGVNSGAVVPIFVFRQFAGAASIDSHREHAFSDDDLVLLRFMAEMLVAVLHRKRIHVQLEELVRSKDQFIASVSHELRTPLTTVVGLAEELRTRPDDFDEHERAEFHRLLAEQAAEVSDIVEDLLVVARADIGKVSIQSTHVDLRPEIDSVLRGFVDARRVAVVADGDDQIVADRTRLRQVVRNLISNALRYGGPTVEVHLGRNGRYAVIEIADDGASITAAQADELFEPYKHTAQVEGRPPSIGLGLTVGRKLARLMGGDLAFVTREGWTVFRLLLPLAVESSADGFEWTGSETLSSTDGGLQLPAVAGASPEPESAIASRIDPAAT